MRALASESRGCKANSYVLVSKSDLQPTDAEWKDIALRRQGRRVEEHLRIRPTVSNRCFGASSGSRANRCSASSGHWSFVLGQGRTTNDPEPAAYFASKSTVFTGRSQWASRISKRRCSSRS